MITITFLVISILAYWFFRQLANEAEKELGFHSWLPTVFRRLAVIVVIIGVMAIRLLYFNF